MRTIIYFFLLSLFLSCSEKPATPFIKDGVSFMCPAGWEITDEEKIDESGYYLSAEKAGLSESGLLSVTWMNDTLQLEEWIGICKDELKNNVVYKNSNLVFAPTTKSQFGVYPSITAHFSFKLLGLAHDGQIQVFYAPHKTFAIIRQEALEDKDKNKAGFEVLEKTFKVE
jgi:hypothetical protein